MKTISQDIIEQDVTSNSYALLETLKNTNLDDETIMLKLASILLKAQNITGANKIGKTENEIERLIKNASYGGRGGSRRDGGRGRRNNRYGNNRGSYRNGGGRGNRNRRDRRR